MTTSNNNNNSSTTFKKWCGRTVFVLSCVPTKRLAVSADAVGAAAVFFSSVVAASGAGGASVLPLDAAAVALASLTDLFCCVVAFGFC